MEANTVESLLALSDDEFRSVVDSAVRHPPDPRTGEPGDPRGTLLRDPRLWSRWYYTLISSKKSVEGQLAAKKADLAAARAQGNLTKKDLASFERWRAGALRFKSGVENQLVEARQLRERKDEQRTMAIFERNMLIAAIINHREHQCDDSCDDGECAADRKLWSLVSDTH